MGKTDTFKYVYIPADVSEPLQELSLSYTEEDQVQCLLNNLRVSHSCVAPYISQHRAPATGLSHTPIGMARSIRLGVGAHHARCT